MKFAHSYWFRPSRFDRYTEKSRRQIETNLYCYALSYTYVHNLGYEVNLYADQEGIDYLGIIPYDKVIKLDIPENASTRFWAQSKFYALKKMELGEIHIDGDVMIKSDGIPAYRYLNGEFLFENDNLFNKFGNADVVVQSFEDLLMVNNAPYPKCRKVLVTVNYGDNAFNPSEVMEMPNTGVTQINNAELKKLYLKSYFDLMDSIIESGLDKTSDPSIDFDLITEQQLIGQVCHKYGFTINSLFKTSVGPYLRANKDLYVHYLGQKKYIMLNLIKKQLSELNSELFNRINLKLSQIL